MSILFLRSSVSVGDTTAPTLSSAVGTETGATTATVGASTNEGNGTLYVVVTTSATQPSIAQIKTGDDHTGANATYASSQAISSTGAKEFSATGLTAETTYYAHLVHTDAAANDSNRISSASFITDAAGASGVFFNPNVDAASTVLSMFDDQNNTPFATLDTTIVRPGRTKCILLTYAADEDGTDLIVEGAALGGQFVASTGVFCRSYERFDGPWEGNWPQGLKTARYFSRPDLIGCQGAPYDVPYLSEKIVYPGYETSPDPRDEDYAASGSWAYCNRPEIEATYGAGQNFGNGMPYIRTGVWYRWERWMVMNSADEAADGVLEIRIDGVTVLSRTNVVYRSSSNGAGGTSEGYGTQWMAMWFGGNYSNTGTFTAPSTLYRRIDDPYLSTTADWL